ncbi:26S proteasome regulatory subunit RPN13 [Coccomyxa sp. Obi]|nr:26S proteasome regulatory subunit RPN13 [Coccomyxa sp. Obi]
MQLPDPPSRTLLVVQAGISNLVDNKLVADPRKGQIEICLDRFDLVYFSWTERTEEGPSQRGPEFSFCIEFHCWVTFELIEGRRVWVLKHPAAGLQLFFWAQEPDTGQDHHIALTITEYLNLNAAKEDEPSADAATDSGVAAAIEALKRRRDEIEAQAANEAPQLPASIMAKHLASMLGSIQVPPQQPGTVAPAAASSSSAPAVDAKALAAALGNISSGRVQMQRAPGPNLADVLTPEVIIPLLRQPGMLERLAPYLPEEHRNEAALMDLAASVQLRHQLSILGTALLTAQLDPSQFGLSPNGYTAADFLESIQKKVDEEGDGANSASDQA